MGNGEQQKISESFPLGLGDVLHGLNHNIRLPRSRCFYVL